MLTDRADTLGDILGEIADALQIGSHADGADDSAQVLCHGLTLGDQRHRLLVEVALLCVHDRIVGNHALRQCIVAIKKRAGRGLQH